jgi:N-glycosidase YbiA
MQNRIETPIIREFSGEYRFLSNFWPCSVIYDGHIYHSVEHAYQAAKTLDLNERARVRNCSSSGSAKKEGRKLTLREDWNGVRLSIMWHLVFHKFFFNHDLEKRLLDTQDNALQEGNYWNDAFWGVDLKTGKGENWLGRILMQVRDRLTWSLQQ